ncbi:hypothetical protein [Desulfobulbus sp.]|uniref:hypothetical protein n=1 Tax=Desulfobulbus sp. TaxID=895 RepID=UPI00286F9CE1|nr:hypothetical protein [Desulfobulbus sp.]
MRTFLLLLFFCSVVLSTSAFAVEPGAKAFVERGLSAYLTDGPDAAIKAWLKGSGMEGNTQALTQANSLRQIEDFYGKPESYDIVKENTISPRSVMVVFTINHAKGIVFGRFQVYRTKSGEWVATEFKFNTEAAVLLPPEMVFGKLP